MKVLLFAAMSLAPKFAESTDTENQVRQPVVQTSPVPGGCDTPVGERTSEVGCYLDATELLRKRRPIKSSL